MFDCWWTRFSYNEFLCWLKWRLTLSTSCVFFSSGPSIGAVEFCMPVPGFWGNPRWNFSTDSGSACVFKSPNRCSTKQEMHELHWVRKDPSFSIPAYPLFLNTNSCSHAGCIIPKPTFQAMHPSYVSFEGATCRTTGFRSSFVSLSREMVGVKSWNIHWKECSCYNWWFYMGLVFYNWMIGILEY